MLVLEIGVDEINMQGGRAGNTLVDGNKKGDCVHFAPAGNKIKRKSSTKMSL